MGSFFDRKFLEANADRHKTIAADVLIKNVSQRADVYLSYDWDRDLSGVGCARVAKINDMLVARGLKTVFTADKIQSAAARHKAIEDLHGAYCAVIFISRRYLDRVHEEPEEGDPKTSCGLEFSYACRKGVKRLIPVVLDKRILSTEEWIGEVGMVLGGKAPIDCSDESAYDVRINDLMRHIVSTNGGTLRDVLSAPIWKEMIASKLQDEVEVMMSAAMAGSAALSAAQKVSPEDVLIDELTVWITSTTDILRFKANQYAALLVDNNVGSVEKMKKKVNRNEYFLVELGIPMEDAGKMTKLLLDPPTAAGKTAVSAAAQQPVRGQVNNAGARNQNSPHAGMHFVVEPSAPPLPQPQLPPLQHPQHPQQQQPHHGPNQQARHSPHAHGHHSTNHATAHGDGSISPLAGDNASAAGSTGTRGSAHSQHSAPSGPSHDNRHQRGWFNSRS